MDEKLRLLNSDISDEDLKAKIDDVKDTKIRILIDGTYLFSESPGDLEDLKDFWSKGKGRPLLKAHIYASSNGFIIDNTGPWSTSYDHNDANILKTEQENTEEMFSFLKANEEWLAFYERVLYLTVSCYRFPKEFLLKRFKNPK